MVKVFAPASIGNVSVGFDVLGMAVTPISGELLGDTVEIDVAENGISDLNCIGSFKDVLPPNKEDNIVWHALQLFEQQLADKSIAVSAVSMTLNKNMPVGSGLGSSACSIVAALVALNEFYQQPFNQQELLFMMGAMEAKISGSLHYDNVAPCFIGGLQLMSSDAKVISRTLPSFDELYWVMAYPGIEMSTKAAREALPENYSRGQLIEFGQNLASFIDACHRQDCDSAMQSIVDIVAEPYRCNLLPKFKENKNYVLANGAKAAGISGSGPTLFVACDDLQKAQQLSQYLQQNYLQSNTGFIHICKTDTAGARVI
ncbi:homoserine kinase [Thalassotalea crassostreae]|uniref:homoserine kinase n=1 Tax=Thalassotalea crassostreae TaxID=1763536 RepID=UPI000A5B348A|nr:homoserine kinase [Thalassotalea crassostreae]